MAIYDYILDVEAHSLKRCCFWMPRFGTALPVSPAKKDMTTIREQSIQWLIDKPGDFTVNKLAVDLGVGRRQALNALHGLKHGLGEQLQHHGSGSSSDSPRTVLVLQADEFGETGRPPRCRSDG